MKKPPKGFIVDVSVSSIKHSPEYIEEIIGIKATEASHAKNEVYKYNTWTLEADWGLETIQEQIDSVLSQVSEHAEKFRKLEDCDVTLSVLLYVDFKKNHRPNGTPSFCISEEQIALLQSMNASFVID